MAGTLLVGKFSGSKVFQSINRTNRTEELCNSNTNLPVNGYIFFFLVH